MLKIIKIKSEILLRKLGAKFGFDFKMTDEERMMLLLKHNKINLIYDVGANTGQYAKELFSLGYEGRIVSVEPLSQAYEILIKNSKRNKNWEVLDRCALGETEEEVEINITGNSVSSSLLEVLPGHIDAEPASRIIGREKVKICRLDSISDDYIQKNDTILLKIDTQGFEDKVLNGAVETIKKVKGIQLEMSLVKLFESQSLFMELIERLSTRGFFLNSIEPAFTNKQTGRLLQVNGLFFRE